MLDCAQRLGKPHSPIEEDKMLKNRLLITLVGLSIAVLVVLSIGTLAFTQQTPSAVEDNRLAPLNWYFSHDHAIIDGNNDTGMQPRAPRSGWVYHYDSVTNKWYAYHYEATPAGLLIDEPYELKNGPGNSGNGCGLDRAESDC
jgi:hypothetical protein